MSKVIVVMIVAVLLAGCSGMTKTQQGALLGAGTGAAIGQLAGKDTKGTLIGAGVGGTLGALAGDHAEKEEMARSQAYNQGYQQGYSQGYGQPAETPRTY